MEFFYFILLYIIENIVYFGLILLSIFMLIFWTFKQIMKRRLIYFCIGVVIIVSVFTLFVSYINNNSSLQNDIVKFEKKFDIVIPRKYVLINRRKLILGPEFLTRLELRFDSVDVMKIIQSLNNSKKITIYKNIDSYSFKKNESDNSSGYISTKTGELTLSDYYSLYILIH